MGPNLKSPPLVEAICEFRFDASSPWDWTIPGRLFEKIRTEFSERSQVDGFGLEIQASPGMLPVAQVHTAPGRVQLKRPDGSAMVQVGQNVLAINHFRPYSNWVVFRDLVLEVIDDYYILTGNARLERIGLRYVNQIVLPSAPLEIGDFITLKPPLTGLLDRPLRGFYQRYELSYDSPAGVLVHQTGIQKSEARSSLIVDLDFGSNEVSNLRERQAVSSLLDAAHERVEEAFLASLNVSFYEKLKVAET
jgi:uncharacterized protein (TIGR04255 family)